jgi:excisionase family DNA binding protein
MQDAVDSAGREVLNDRQAAAFLGVSPGTLANWRSQGTVGVPYLRLGRAVRYRRSDLERYLSAKTVGAVEAQ